MEIKETLKKKLSDLLKDKNTRDDVIGVVVDVIDKNVDLKDVIEDEGFLTSAAQLVLDQIARHERKLSKRYEAFIVSEQRRLSSRNLEKPLSIHG